MIVSIKIEFCSQMFVRVTNVQIERKMWLKNLCILMQLASHVLMHTSITSSSITTSIAGITTSIISITNSIASIREGIKFFLIWKFWIVRDPPTFLAKLWKDLIFLWKKTYFMITPLWNRWAPPPFCKKISVFLIRKFWIVRDPPPPFHNFFAKKIWFFYEKKLILW